MTDAKTSGRQRVLWGGQIVFNAGGSAVDCTVREYSEEGALLLLPMTMGIPERFTLHLTSGRGDRPCRIVGRKSDRIEVAFC